MHLFESKRPCVFDKIASICDFYSQAIFKFSLCQIPLHLLRNNGSSTSNVIKQGLFVGGKFILTFDFDQNVTKMKRRMQEIHSLVGKCVNHKVLM